MEPAQARLIAGGFFFVLSLLFLAMTFFAAYHTWKTGRFSSGFPIVPTIFAVVGGLFTGWWKAVLLIVLFDLVSLFIPIETAEKKGARKPPKRKG